VLASPAVGIFLEPESLGRFPVALVTGFLGSGKTTLLNRLLAHKAMAKTGVVVNEYGDVALDQHLIAASDGEVTVMANGCLCCVLQGDFEGIVGTLFARRASGEVPAFDRLIVETTGLADPAPIVQLLLNSPLLVPHVRLDAVIATVDAVHGARALDAHREAVKQAALADRLVLTKTDLVDAGAADALAARLAALNPAAPLHRARLGEIDPTLLFGAGDAARIAERAAREAEHGHRHGDGIVTFCLAAETPLDWPALSRWLTRLRVGEGERLLRVKGLLNVAGEDGPVVIHGVHHVFHPPVKLPRWPDADRRTRIVIIGDGLDRQAVEEGWRAFLAGAARETGDARQWA